MNPIPEAALLEQLESFRGFSYSLDAPAYPDDLPGVSVPVAPPNQTNCCAFVEGLIIPVADQWVQDFFWGLAQHKRMMIQGPDLYSPIEELIDSGLAVGIDSDGPPGDWAVMQGWNSNHTRGHTLIIARHEQGTGQILTLEANRGHGVYGVGHRGLGTIDKWAGFDFDARLAESPVTWLDLCESYPNRSVCALLIG